LWKVKEPGLRGVSAPKDSLVSVRGSPKLPRIGCWRPNGLIG
jgi:hypothetical protein